MPKILATGVNLGAIRVESGARGYRLVGPDIGIDEGVAQVANLVELGSGKDTTVAAEPSDIVVDRCYRHGNDDPAIDGLVPSDIKIRRDLSTTACQTSSSRTSRPPAIPTASSTHSTRRT